MKKSIFQGVVLAIGCTATVSAFAGLGLSVSVTAKTYYCTTGSFSTSNCSKNDTSNLLPSSITISQDAVDGINDQFSSGDFVGAVLGGSTPDKMWSYPIGSSVGEGLALSSSTLTASGDEGTHDIDIEAYYVPCGSSPTSDGLKTNGTSVEGTAITSTAISIAHSSSSTCSSGGNVYLTFNPQANALESNGFIYPGDYTGDINLTVAALSG